MNLLTERMPDTVEVDGRTVPIHTDFRLWAWLQIQCAKNEFGNEQLAALLTRAYGENVNTLSVDGMAQAAMKFFMRGEQLNEGKDDSSDSGSSPLFDLEQDSIRVVAGFQSEYGIDLTSAEMHWWRFRALLEELFSEDKLHDVIHYRAVKLGSVPKDQQKFYRAKKNAYALAREDDPETLEDFNKQMIDRYRKAVEEVSGNGK